MARKKKEQPEDEVNEARDAALDKALGDITTGTVGNCCGGCTEQTDHEPVFFQYLQQSFTDLSEGNVGKNIHKK